MYNHVLVPIAFDTEDRPEASLRAARAMAAPGAKVTLLHVMEEGAPFAIYRLAEEDLQAMENALRAEMQEMAAGFEKPAVQVVRGHSGRTIVEWARDNDPDCIVIDSHRPGLQDYFLGSTAEYVVRHADCTVLVVR